jgi:hypothetical protein
MPYASNERARTQTCRRGPAPVIWLVWSGTPGGCPDPALDHMVMAIPPSVLP